MQWFARFILCSLVVCSTTLAQSLTTIVPDGKPHRFEARDRQFWIDGEPTMLLAGEMHFGRVVPQFWDHRLKQMRAMGLNAVSMYLFWNQVEPREGQFDFTGFNDVRRFVKLAQDNGLWVILRPGPYCCAETEFGGIPWWLLKDKTIRLRSNDPKFVEPARRYIVRLSQEIGDLTVSRGGPIVMVQLDNEYGRVDDYMKSLQTVFRDDAKFDCQLFTCDHSRAQTWRATDLLPGVIHCRNGLRNDEMFNQSAAAIGEFPVFTPEVYTAWYSIWGQPLETRGIDEQIAWMNYLIDRQYSFNLYMFHGGTNFGFTAGSNQWRPVQTSYNYDAPVDEAGRTTAKYRALRELLATRFKRELPAIPPDPRVIEIPTITLDETSPLLDALPDKPALEAAEPVSMEDFDQGYGFVLYRHQFDSGVKGTLELNRALDYAIVMVNGRTVGRSFAGYGPNSPRVQLNEDGPATLDILVHNLGRTSSPFNQATGRKGMTDGASVNGQRIEGWKMYSLPMNTPPKFQPSAKPPSGPGLHRGRFTLDKTGETFLDLRNWRFGVVWVNGHNLGRFWDRGALRSLYLPSVWQKQGENEIVILELHEPPEKPQINGVTNIIEEAPKPFGFERGARGRPTTQ